MRNKVFLPWIFPLSLVTSATFLNFLLKLFNMNRRSRNISNINIVKEFVKEKRKPIQKVLSKTRTSLEEFQSFKRLNDDHANAGPESEKENVVVKRR